ncbi:MULTISPECIES: cytochrome c nitrite reductase small subunit [Thermodesulfovibrio]|uniref:cytochrome c nitrite reductase small subunit n=2 Tax=Thermodesulfovibrionaceae TaxID=2811504 RepID=UPI0003F51E7D|nr:MULTISPECIES: cytochrome c nitrite reductase small subunit [Thermodesulfovibrio]
MQKKWAKYGILAIFFLLFLIILLSKNILAKTNSPEFCAKCHVMQDEYVTLMKGGIHNSLRCVDCHLPNDSKANFYLWKGIDGTKDVVHFYSGSVPERIIISAHGKKIVQENCVRCHEGIVSKINVSDRKCWDCHKRISHRQAGLRETI